jgi:hypothetical protein
MIGQRYLFAAGLAVSAAGLVMASGVSTAAAASTTGAGAARPNVIHPMWYCSGGNCIGTAESSATYYPRNGDQPYNISGETVTVQCWYTGAPYSDNIWDHVIKLDNNSADGHVADEFINFGGNTAKSLGLPECG